MTVESGLRKAYDRCLTTLSPDRAILIECALESSQPGAGTDALKELYGSIARSAEERTQLLPDIHSIVTLYNKPASGGVNAKTACRVFSKIDDFFETDFSVYTDVRFAAIDSATKNRITTYTAAGIRSGLSDENVDDAIRSSKLGPYEPFGLYIGLGEETDSAVFAMFDALLSDAGTQNPDKELSELERKYRYKYKAINCVIKGTGTGIAAICAANPCINPVNY